MAASVEAGSNHPFARLICRTAADRRLRLQPAINFNEYPGQGVEAIIGRIPVRVGTAAWLKEEGADISAETLTKADQLSLKGMIPLFVSSGKYSKGLNRIRRALVTIAEENSDDDGRISSSQLGNLLGKQFPDFDVRNYKYKKFVPFIESLDLFETIREDLNVYFKLK